MKISLFVICGLLLVCLVQGKIYSQQTFTASNNKTQSSFTFFYDGYIVVSVDQYGGDEVNKTSQLSQFSVDGKLFRNISLPISCFVIPCYTRTLFIQMQGSQLLLIADADYYNVTYNHIEYISINLNEFLVTQDTKGDVKFYPTGLITFDQKNAILENTFISSSIITRYYSYINIYTLEITGTVSYTNKFSGTLPAASFYDPTYYDYFNLCVQTGSSASAYYAQISLPSFKIGSVTNTECSYYSQFNQNYEEVLLFDNPNYEPNVILSRYKVSNGTISHFGDDMTVIKGAESYGFASSANFAFGIAVNRPNTTVTQFALSSPLRILDQISVPNVELWVPQAMTHYIIDEINQNFVVNNQNNIFVFSWNNA
eukprot:TRINITY_DN2579_c0_g1_i8.p1 TRINITY_DN2579_c0_g1~~TRINITY_DN2579_c0_g1_i8.p1  ORF type:complete len:370 (+),score=59.03 TRINITY_DN2579_c0_g1_i8:270-1379(+)